jgi:hypothetical protein
MKNKLKYQPFFLKPLSVFIFLTLSYFSFGQFSVKILNEDFNSNIMRWDIQDNESDKMEIVKGKYILNNKTEGSALTSCIDNPNLQSENFCITANFSKIKGIDNNGFGLTWGGSDVNNEFEFVISANGFFKILKWENGKKEIIRDWTYQSAINKWDSTNNELKIECLHDIIRYYINGNYIAATKYFKPFGTKAGFVINEIMEVEVQDIIIENLTIIDHNNPSPDLQSLKINKLEFFGTNSSGILENGENGTLNIEISNNGTIEVNDLILTISPPDPPNGLIYDPLVMIDNLKPGESKQCKVQFTTSQELSNQIIPLTVTISDINNAIIDSKSMNLETKAKTNTNSDIQIPDPEINDENNVKPSNEVFDNCASGCISGGIAVLIEAIFSLF